MAVDKDVSYFSEFDKMKHKPDFSFLANGDDNTKMLESFGGYNNAWKRFAINGKICGAEHTDYFSDGFYTAGRRL